MRLVIGADLEGHDRERLRNVISDRTGTNKRTIDAAIAAARKEHEGRQKQEERDRGTANRRDERPRIAAPAQDAPWIPQAEVINDVLSMSAWSVPPIRDMENDSARKKMRRIPGMHLLTSDTANPDEVPNSAPTQESSRGRGEHEPSIQPKETNVMVDETSYLPAPEQLCLVKMTEMEVAEDDRGAHRLRR